MKERGEVRGKGKRGKGKKGVDDEEVEDETGKRKERAPMGRKKRGVVKMGRRKEMTKCVLQRKKKGGKREKE